MNNLLAQASKLGILGSPLPTFLKARESIRRVCEYAITATGGATPPVDVAAVEMIFVARSLTLLHQRYVYIKTKFSTSLPTLTELEEAVCEHGDAAKEDGVPNLSPTWSFRLRLFPDEQAAVEIVDDSLCPGILDTGEGLFALQRVLPETRPAMGFHGGSSSADGDVTFAPVSTGARRVRRVPVTGQCDTFNYYWPLICGTQSTEELVRSDGDATVRLTLWAFYMWRKSATGTRPVWYTLLSTLSFTLTRWTDIMKYDEMKPGDKVEIFWPEDREWYPGTMGDTDEDGKTTIKYDDGDVETLLLKEERMRVLHSVAAKGKRKEAAALQESTAGNYGGHWKKFVKFCEEDGLQWLPASGATVPLCVHKAALVLPLATEEQLGLFRACVYVVVAFVTFGRPLTGTAMLRKSLLRDSEGLSVVLEKEKGSGQCVVARCYEEYIDGSRHGRLLEAAV
ncbi:hypothetical protein CYMTET_11761 [Cymbomonas tetramitiformis]|uniref:Uncharacterized protein n=1 Tax=Cymbomonas tetramitiformis TaxID=36881 RepID=A0AAE0GLN0_9CHLO|nr:hypothetical protein CYMTET_11761 [Cymbomonas tetramitiformis]